MAVLDEAGVHQARADADAELVIGTQADVLIDGFPQEPPGLGRRSHWTAGRAAVRSLVR